MVKRDAEECEKKWTNLVVTAKNAHSVFTTESRKTGGGPAPQPLDALTAAVCDVLGVESASLVGVPGGMDSSDIEFATASEHEITQASNSIDFLMCLTDSELEDSAESAASPASPDPLPILSRPVQRHHGMTSTPLAIQPRSEEAALKVAILKEELLNWKLKNELLKIEIEQKKI